MLVGDGVTSKPNSEVSHVIPQSQLLIWDVAGVSEHTFSKDVIRQDALVGVKPELLDVTDPMMMEAAVDAESQYRRSGSVSPRCSMVELSLPLMCRTTSLSKTLCSPSNGALMSQM